MPDIPKPSAPAIDGQNKDFYADNMSLSGKAIRELAYKAYIVAAEQGIIVEAWLPETLMLDVAAKYDAPFEQGLGSLSSLAGISSMARFLGLSLTTQAMTAQVWQGGSFIDLSIPLVFQTENSAANDVMLPIKQLLSLTMPKDPGGGGFLTAPGPRIDINKLGSNGIDLVKSAGGAISDAVTGIISGSGSVSDTGKTLAPGSSFLDRAANKANDVAKTVSNALVNSVTNNISLYIGQFLYFPSVVITDVSPTYDVVLGVDKNPVRASVNVGIRTFYMPTSQDIETMFPSAQTRASNSNSANLSR